MAGIEVTVDSAIRARDVSPPQAHHEASARRADEPAVADPRGARTGTGPASTSPSQHQPSQHAPSQGVATGTRRASTGPDRTGRARPAPPRRPRRQRTPPPARITATPAAPPQPSRSPAQRATADRGRSPPQAPVAPPRSPTDTGRLKAAVSAVGPSVASARPPTRPRSTWPPLRLPAPLAVPFVVGGHPRRRACRSAPGERRVHERLGGDRDSMGTGYIQGPQAQDVRVVVQPGQPRVSVVQATRTPMPGILFAAICSRSPYTMPRLAGLAATPRRPPLRVHRIVVQRLVGSGSATVHSLVRPSAAGPISAALSRSGRSQIPGQRAGRHLSTRRPARLPRPALHPQVNNLPYPVNPEVFIPRPAASRSAARPPHGP